MSVTRRPACATRKFPEVTFVMLYFHFLFRRKVTPACPLLASEWYSRWPLTCSRVLTLYPLLRISPSPTMLHFMLFLSVLSRACLLVMFHIVCCHPHSLPLGVVFLDPEILSTPVCSIGGSEPPPRSQTSMLLGTGGGAWFICTFHAGLHGLPFHAG